MIGVVVNPLALRHLRDRRTTRRLVRALGGRGEVVETLSLEHLERVAHEFHAAGVTHLAISGGDGTLGTTLSAFRRAFGTAPLPVVTPLRGGTMNTISNGLGMPPRAPEQLLRGLVESLGSGGPPLRARLRPSMLVDGQRVAFLFGTGVAYGFLAEYYDAGAARPGPWVAGRTLARLAASALVGGASFRRAAAGVELALRVDGERWAVRGYLGVLAGTVDAVGLGFRPFHLLRPDATDAFHLLALVGPASRIVGRLPRVHAGRPLGGDCARETLARSVELRPSRPGGVRWFADGDLGRSEGATQLALGPVVHFAWPG